MTPRPLASGDGGHDGGTKAKAPAPLAIGLGVIALLAFYRAMVFIHEIMHQRRSLSRSFVIAWNVLCGIPGLLPSFLYETHRDHHLPRLYGSARDGEYFPPAQPPSTSGLLVLAAAPLRLPAAFLRFLVAAPLGWCLPRLRVHILGRMSALVVHGNYVRRDVGEARAPAHWLIQEAACFVCCAGAVAATAAGFIPASRILELWLIASGAALLQSLRVLVAHGYRNDGEPMTFAQQVLDSRSFPGGFAELWAPLGLRFHAEHHLLPHLPYHALPEAHRRLMRAIPPAAPFRLTVETSLARALLRFVTGARPGMAG